MSAAATKAAPHRVTVCTANVYGDRDSHERLVDLGAPTALEFFKWLADTMGMPPSLLFAMTEFHLPHSLLQFTSQLALRRTATHLYARNWDGLTLAHLDIEDGATIRCEPRQMLSPLLDLVDPDAEMPLDIVRTLHLRRELVLPAVEWVPGAPLPVPLPADQTAHRLSRLIDRLAKWIEEVRARGVLVYAAPMLLLSAVFGAVRKRLADLPVSRTPQTGGEPGPYDPFSKTDAQADFERQIEEAIRASVADVDRDHARQQDAALRESVAEPQLAQDDIALAYALSLSQQADYGGAGLLDDDTADGLLDDDTDGGATDHYCEGAACWCAAPASEDESPAAAAAAE